uniref:RING-type domain-containing protein n=1 Tax=Anabas testudineus TaxID=64144 RepID=A0A7N6ACU1_ANATE
MLRCRRCRKGVIESTCLETVGEVSQCLCFQVLHPITIHYMIYVSVVSVQAQWTVGKLNCQNCRARLGGFNFINRCECPCGRDATVHLNKSRVDPDQKHHVLIVQLRRTRPEKGGRASLLSDHPQNSEDRPALHSPQLNCAAVTSHISPTEPSETPPASPASNRLSKREKNRLKSARRKQRRRERWLRSQIEQDVCGSLLDSEEEVREGLTCAVCLDVYFSPYSCQPCGHVFCEPCLRTLARNRPTNTPCPLCRMLISHTNFHKELNQTAETFFPKVYCGRKQNFQSAPCAKWPLPACHKRTFRSFWGQPRQGATARRRWRFTHAGFTLHALDFTDMRGWLFDIGLVIIYIHSVNWILAFLLLSFLMYYFFF